VALPSGSSRRAIIHEVVDSLLFGALLAHAILGEAVDAAWIDRVVDQLWRGIAGPAGPTPSSPVNGDPR